jgi:hypothetical protein
MARWTGGTVGSMVDRVAPRTMGAVAPCPVGIGHSPAATGDEEGDEAKPVKGSPGHERRWRGGAVAETNGGGSSSSHERRRVRESSRVMS